MQGLMKIGSLLLLALLVGCGLPTKLIKPVSDKSQVEAVAVNPAESWPKEELTAKALYDILLAEIAGKRGYIDVSSTHYVQAALESQDPRVSARAMRITLYTKNDKASVMLAKHWIRLQPENVEVRRSLIHLSMRAGQDDEALRHLTYLLQASHDRDEVYQGLREVMLASDRLLAIKVMEGLLALYPQDISAHRLYGQLLMLNKQPDAAVKQFQWVLAQDTQDVDALTALGLAALDEKRFAVAKNYFERVIALNNTARFNVYYYMGLVANKQGNIDQVEHWFAKVTQGQFLLTAGIERANIMQQHGELFEARTLLRLLSKRQPSATKQLIVVEGTLLMRSGLHQEALVLFTKALAQWGNSPVLLYGRMEAAVALGGIKQGEKDLLKIIEQRPNDANVLNTIGYLLLEETDRYQEALVYIDRALTLVPNSQAIIDSMGWAYYRLQQYDKALVYLKKAHAIGDEAEIAAHLGELLWVMGRNQEAKDIWRKSSQKHPGDAYLQEVMQRLLP